jgi:PBP1b-binding outer membrane lipoprotein LpoB
MTKPKLLSLLLLTPFLLVGCISPYSPIEADEAMPQMMDDSSINESNN